MKTNHFFILAVMFLSCNMLKAQEEQSNKTKIIVADAQVYTGGFSDNSLTNSLNNLIKLAPNSTLANEDFSRFNRRGDNYSNFSNVFGISIGLDFENEASKTRASRQLRIGFVYQNSNGISGSLSREERSGFDTLTSSRTGARYFVDSIYSENYFYDYYYEQFRLDVSLIYRTNQNNRWMAYAGVGLNFGLSINAQTEISYDDYYYTSVSYSDPFSEQSYPSYNNINNEIIDNKTNFGGSVYVPIGVDFRLGNRVEFWRSIHLFYELRPGINYLNVPEIESSVSGSVQHSGGVRIVFNG